ncbi:MAG TPA: DUF1552 domain-containing protein, partial [Polyangiaceae bacterium]|nr:DUF1552 domain-containing protein [Polyangiaceae bacterium]
KLSRRRMLRGLGGAFLALPWLESLDGERVAWAQSGSAPVPPFAIFFRQANGVATAQLTGELGAEPERFWPRSEGALDAANLDGRALGALTSHAGRLLVVGNVNMQEFPYGDGHARGALQALTARGPVLANQGGNSEADGESIDHRIGRELNANGNESLFTYAGTPGGWLGGSCISYRGPGMRRSALTSPQSAFRALTGGVDGGSGASQAQQRQQSINDRVRGDLDALLGAPRLSSADRARLDLHLSSVRDIERALGCGAEPRLSESIRNAGPSSTDGDQVLTHARLYMDIAALAVACGHTRAVTIQVGSGNDGSTRYHDPSTGLAMEGNFHFISHRRLSHNSEGTILPHSDLLHHAIDVQFAETFRYLLEKLQQQQVPTGSLLDAGMTIWFNDLGNGPAHSAKNCPWIIAGSAGGVLKQGQFIRISNGDESAVNHARLLNTIGSAAGLRKLNGDWIDDFGDPSLERAPLGELLV